MHRVVIYKTGWFAKQFFNTTRFDERGEPSHAYNVSDEMFKVLVNERAGFIEGETPPWVIELEKENLREVEEIEKRKRREQQEREDERTRHELNVHSRLADEKARLDEMARIQHEQIEEQRRRISENIEAEKAAEEARLKAEQEQMTKRSAELKRVAALEAEENDG
jgi:hypothetical protein